jgi:CheY-like chemotaxis protein
MRNTVLVIDSQWCRQELARVVLQTAGYHVLTAGDGPAGLALARGHRPIAIVLDVQMPGREAADTYAALRRDRRTAGVPIILVTGDVTGEQLASEVDAARTSCLRRPFPAPQLLNVVNQMVQQMPLAG